MLYSGESLMLPPAFVAQVGRASGSAGNTKVVGSGLTQVAFFIKKSLQILKNLKNTIDIV